MRIKDIYTFQKNKKKKIKIKEIKIKKAKGEIDMDYTLKQSRKHLGKYKIKRLKIDATCYTKKQMKEMYPNKDYVKVGEIGNKNGEYVGSTELCNVKLPVYSVGSYNKLTEKPVGYIEVGKKNYVATVKNVFAQRLIVLLIILVMPFVVFEDARLFVASIVNELFVNKGENIKAPDLDPNAQDWQGHLPQEENKGQGKGIQIPGYKTIRLKAGQTNQAISLVNPAPNACYFTISFVLADTGEVIYKSKMVAPGKGLYSAKLTRPLAAGKYNMILKYETNSLDGLAKMNGANVNVELVVN